MQSNRSKDILQLMKKGRIPGLSIATVTGNELWSAALGVADMSTQKQVTEETIFEAASLSKPLFAFLIYKLIEAKKLPTNFLDVPLVTKNPIQAFHGRDSDKPVTFKYSVTPRLLLSHRSGLPNWINPDDKHEYDKPEKETFSYSGEGFHYLQKAIIEATNAGANLMTTAPDYALFLKACLTEKNPFFKKEFLTECVSMTLDQEAVKKAVKKEIPATVLASIFWSPGWGVQKTPEGTILFHWGHNDNARAFVAINLNKETAMVYFANSSNGLSILRDIVKMTIGNMEPTLDYLCGKFN